MRSHYISETKEGELAREVEENDGGRFPVQGNGAMMSGEESESDDLVEELGFSRTSSGARDFEDRRCRNLMGSLLLVLDRWKVGYFMRILEYFEELVNRLETCWRRNGGLNSPKGF